MNRATWNNDRARVFARGLYYVAACDGLDPREEAALRVFVERTGLPDDLESLGAEPFDYAEATAVLDSTWLRRTFIQACRLMVRMDGRVSNAERDAMRAMGAALGVGEQIALEEVSESPRPEEIVEWVSARAVDFVSWDDRAQRGYLWAFPHPEHPLAEGAAVRVADGQAVVVRHEEQVTDTLGPGEYEIVPDTLAGLAGAAAWSGGPVMASLVFVRTSPSSLLRWGTSNAVTLASSEHGELPIRAFGRFSAAFADPREVVERFTRRGVPTNAELDVRLRRVVSGRFGAALGQLAYDTDERLLELLNDLDALKDAVRPELSTQLARSGIRLERFLIENLTGPLELALKPVSRASQSRTLVGRTMMGGVGGDPAITLRPCPECLAPTPVTARFCPRCGTSQRAACNQCGQDVPTRARFCPNCGTKRLD